MALDHTLKLSGKYLEGKHMHRGFDSISCHLCKKFEVGHMLDLYIFYCQDIDKILRLNSIFDRRDKD